LRIARPAAARPRDAARPIRAHSARRGHCVEPGSSGCAVAGPPPRAPGAAAPGRRDARFDSRGPDRVGRPPAPAPGRAQPALACLDAACGLAPFVPGVTRLGAAGAADAAVRWAIARIEGLAPLFVKGQAALVPVQEEVIRQLVARAAELERAAAATGKTFRVEVIGHTDADGLPGANIPLSRARAAVVRLAIERVVSDRLRLVDEGVGSDDPAVQSDNEQDKQRNRRVTVRVPALSAASR